jgi:DNA-binding beta-propeller fold protein YncE
MKIATLKFNLPTITILIPLVLGLCFLFPGCSSSPYSCDQELQDVSDDGIAAEPDNGMTEEATALAKALAATTYSLTITTDGHGSVKPGSVQTLYAGQLKSIAATPASGYVFSRWTTVSGSAKFLNANSAATTVQLVTGNTVIKANFAKNWSRFNIRVGMSPVGVLFDGTNIWVADENGEDIYKILASTGTVLRVYRGGHGAQYLAYDNVRNNVWVTNPGSNNVTVINATTGKLVTYASGNNPDGIVFDGTSMWVANYAPATVTRIRASDGAILKTIPVGIRGVSNPRLLAYDKVSKKIWVTVGGDNKVKKIDPATNQIIGNYSVPGFPYAIVFDGTFMWVTQGMLNTVAKIRTSDGAILARYNAGVAPNGIAFDGTYIWITDQVYCGAPPFPMTTVCTVTQILASNGAAVETYRVGERPQWVTTGGGYIWVTNGSDNTVSRCTY